MVRRWFYVILLVAVLLGLLVLLIPAPLSEDDPPAGQIEPARSAQNAEPANDAELAADTVDGAFSPDVSSSLLNEQAMNAWRGGDILTAMTLFEQAIDAGPDDPEPHANYGRLLTLMTSYEKALPLLERARDLRPEHAQAWLDLATLYGRVQLLDRSWAAQDEAARIVGRDAITRDEQGRFIVEGTSLW